MKIRGQFWMAVMLGTSMAVACSSTPAAPQATGGFGGTVAPVAGMGTGLPAAGQSAAGTGLGVSGAGGSFAAPPPVACGAKMCTGLLAPPCCVDNALGTCGTVTGGVCMPAPAAAPNCPAVMIPLVMVNACCVEATQMCGVDASLLGMGCLDVTVAAAAIPGSAAFLGNLTPTRCDGTKIITAAGTGGTSAGAGGAAGLSGVGGATSGAGGASGAAGNAGRGGSSAGAGGASGRSGASGH